MLRLLSWNIHKGFSAGNRRFSLEGMRRVLHASGAQIVFLQEVQGEHRGRAASTAGWPVAAQCEYLADQVWSHIAYGRNAVYSEGHHGNAILSQWPILSWENIDVSVTRWERRGVLHAVIRPTGWSQDLHLLCTHLDLVHITRKQQLQRIVARVRDHIPPGSALVLGGDLNDWRGAAHRILVDELGLHEAHTLLHGRPARTFPVAWPLLALDRLYLRGLVPRTAQRLAGAAYRGLSDHAAVAADVEPLT